MALDDQNNLIEYSLAFVRLRKFKAADEVGAYTVADIAHITGLIAGGVL